ncbi:MAG: alkaline phosphatase family protein [Acidimicrobiales bacterium]
MLATAIALAMVLASAGGLVAAHAASASTMYEGLFVGAQTASAVQSQAQQLGYPVNTMTVYADGTDYNTYSPASGPYTLLLGVGALTPAEAATIGQSLVATGHADTIWRIMWEMNQNVSGWFDPWNQNAMSASTYISTFQAIVTAARDVPGQQFQFMWNPNGGSGNENSGRTWNDTYPGDAYVDMVGVDQYDFSGYQANISTAEAFAQQHGKPFAIPEWGLNGTDDPSYINYVSSVCHSGDVALQAYFDYAGSVNSWLGDFPQSQTAFTADFGSPISTGTTTTPPTTTPPVTTAPTTTSPVGAPPVTTPPVTTPPVTTPPVTTPPVTTPPVTTPPTSTPKTMVVMMENQGLSNVETSATPYIDSLTKDYGLATESYGIIHPSLPNYLALASGSTQGQTTDTSPTFPNVTTLASQLATAGVSEQAYAENLPASNQTQDSGYYVAHHNVWVYFPNAPISDADPGTNNATMLAALNSATPPNFVWFTPSVMDDGDGQTTEAASLSGENSFLSSLIPAVQATSWYKSGGKVVVEWDEALDSDTSGINGGAGGHTLTIVVSAAGPSTSSTPVDQIGVLHSLEDTYGLPHLGGSSANGTIDSLLDATVSTPPTTTPPVTTPPTTTPPTTTPPVTTPPTTTPPVTTPPTTTPPTTTPPVKNSAPAVPTGFQVRVTGSTVTLTWTNSAGTLGNDIYRDGNEIAWPGWPNSVINSYQDVAVATGSHTYAVAAYNSSGLGPQTAAITITVATTPPVTTPPTTTPPVTTPPTTTPPVTTPPAGGSGGRHHHGSGRTAEALTAQTTATVHLASHTEHRGHQVPAVG